MTMKSWFRTRVALALGVLSLFGVACNGSKNLLAPSDAVLSLHPTSMFVPANSSTTVRVSLQKSDGSPAKDGTEVVLSTTAGELETKKVRVTGGEASVVYRAGSEPGTAKISASSGSVNAEVNLRVGSAAAGSLTMFVQPAVLPAGGGDAEIIATVSSPTGALVVGAPVTFGTSAGTLSASEVVTDGRGEAKTTLKTTVTATVTAKVLSLEATPVPVRVKLPVKLTINVTPAEPSATQPAKFEISATIDGQPASGQLKVQFGDGAQADLGTINGSGTTTRTYAAEGGYNVTVTFTDSDGIETRETVRITVQAAPTTPPIPGMPGIALPITPPGNIGADDVDPATFSWRNATVLDFNERDIETWAITAQPSFVSIYNPLITFQISDNYSRWFDIAGFRDGPNPNDTWTWGNYWIVVKYQGQIWISTFHWGTRSNGTREVIRNEFQNTFQGRQPMSSWPGPRDGQIIGLFVSTRARNSGPPNNVRERSPIVFIRYNSAEVVGVVP